MCESGLSDDLVVSTGMKSVGGKVTVDTQFICIICLSIVQDPMDCKTCDQSFCSKCI